MCGLSRHVAFDKGDFIGRDGALRERDAPSERVLVTLSIEAIDADASGFEPVKCDGRLVGYTTSGAYGHHVGQSLAMAYVDRDIVRQAPALSVDVVGESRAARVLRKAAWDPRGERLRA
jgi:dimethylglycine dehydrogenase